MMHQKQMRSSHSFIPHVAFAFVLCLLISACTSNEKQTHGTANKFADTTLVRIYTLADQRDAQGVASFFTHPDSVYRSEAALAFASIRNEQYETQLAELLGDSIHSVRHNAAYALGQFATMSTIDKLQQSFDAEKNGKVQGAILEAIGKIVGRTHRNAGDGAHTGQVQQFLQEVEPQNEAALAGYGKALFWMHMAGIQNSSLMQRLPYLMQDARDESKLAIAHAMLRYSGEWSPMWQDYLKQWLGAERDIQVKIAQMSMLTKLELADAENLLIAHATSRAFDQRVRVAAVRAFGRTTDAELSKLIPLLGDASENLVMEILSAFGKSQKAPLPDSYIASVVSQRADIRAMILRLSYDLISDENIYWNTFEKETDPYARVHFAHALGVAPSNHALVFAAAQNEKHYAVKYALGEAYIEMHKHQAWPSDVDFIANACTAMQWGDIGITALLAEALRKEKIEIQQQELVTNSLKTALSKLALPAEVETYNELIRTINYVGIEKMEEKAVDYNHPIDWKYVADISPNQQLKVTTSRGVFIIQLDVENAPGTVGSMLQLAEQGFFDDKYFHRVIPNFVAQGGCPRGDGMGSTSYTLRSEFALHQYSEGAVGVASSGPDTEGCQWFVTHCCIPHLEGAYTIFGYVTHGMDVVQQLTIGDVIKKMERV